MLTDKYIFLTKYFLILMLLLVGLLGCTGQNPPTSTPLEVITPTFIPTQTETKVLDTPTLIPTQTPTLIPTETILPVPTVTPIPSPTSFPTILPTATQIPSIAPPPGIIYRNELGLWQVSADGESIFLLAVPNNTFIDISPDGNRALLSTSFPETTSVINFNSAGEFNLDFSEDYIVCCATWWPERSDLILVEVQPGSEWLGMGFESIPAAIEGEGENAVLHLLGENPTSYGPPSISPNGETLAFDQSGVPWLFSWTNGLQNFNYSSFGFPQLEDPIITHPAWSPDNNQIAWNVAGKALGEWQYGIGLFNLQEYSSQFLSPLTIEGFDGGRSAIYWNPNQEYIAVWNHGRALLWIVAITGTVEFSGEEHSLNSVRGSPWNATGEWLVYTQYDRELEKDIAYVISADGKESYKIGPTERVIWSPDGKWLILSNSHWLYPGEKRLVKVGTWESQPLDLPDDSSIIDWIEISE